MKEFPDPHRRWTFAPGDDTVLKINRRTFLKRAAAGAAALTCADFLRFFIQNGRPYPSKYDLMAAEAAKAAPEPRFLIYWYLEGGWERCRSPSIARADERAIERASSFSR